MLRHRGRTEGAGTSGGGGDDVIRVSGLTSVDDETVTDATEVLVMNSVESEVVVETKVDESDVMVVVTGQVVIEVVMNTVVAPGCSGTETLGTGVTDGTELASVAVHS